MSKVRGELGWILTHLSPARRGWRHRWPLEPASCSCEASLGDWLCPTLPEDKKKGRKSLPRPLKLISAGAWLLTIGHAAGTAGAAGH